MSIVEQVKFIRDAAETRRFHTVPVLRQQNIAEHSWQVTMLYYTLYGQEEPGIRPVLLMAAMCHDMAEFKVGDLPAPGKREMGERFTLVDNRHLDDASTYDFRTAWGMMEEEILSQQDFDWAKFLDDEEKRRLKLCDSMEGMLYCLRERRMGNQEIEGCFGNFRNYVWKLLVHEEKERDLFNDNEWEVFVYIEKEWDRARR